MNRTAEFAARTGTPIADITHCVLVGTRYGCEVWAVGYHTAYSYMTAVVEHDGSTFGRSSTTYDKDITRIDQPQV
jgi:hypothetical protein